MALESTTTSSPGSACGCCDCFLSEFLYMVFLMKAYSKPTPKTGPMELAFENCYPANANCVFQVFYWRSPSSFQSSTLVFLMRFFLSINDFKWMHPFEYIKGCNEKNWNGTIRGTLLPILNKSSVNKNLQEQPLLNNIPFPVLWALH